MRVIQEVILVLDQRDEKKRGRHLVCDIVYASGHMAPSQTESRSLKSKGCKKSCQVWNAVETRQNWIL